MKQRLERINEQIKHELSSIISLKLKDPRVELVTITDVVVSKDLQQAKVYVTTLGDEEKRQQTLVALENAAGFFRTELGKTMKLRVTPTILFEYDYALQQGNRIEKLLSEIKDNNAPLL